MRSRAPRQAAVAALIASVVLLLAAHGPAVSAQEPDPILGEVPADGVALLVTGREIEAPELTDELESRGCEVAALAVTEAGLWLVHIPGAPAFVNAAFPPVLAASEAFVVHCTGGVPAGAGGFVTEEAHGQGTGGFTTLTDARLSRHRGYDRFALEFDHEVIPTYEVRYTTAPQATCGEGSPVSVAGGAVLRLRLEGARIHDDAGRLTIPSRQLTSGLASIAEAREICGLDGAVTWLIGIDRAVPFRLFLMQQPARVIIDVPHVDCDECQAPDDQSGLVGITLAGPQCPVQRAGEPCPDRLIDVPLVFSRDGVPPVELAAGHGGRFLVSLPPGSYEVTRGGAEIFPAMGPQTVTVPQQGYRWLELRLDTGIR